MERVLLSRVVVEFATMKNMFNLLVVSELGQVSEVTRGPKGVWAEGIPARPGFYGSNLGLS